MGKAVEQEEKLKEKVEERVKEIIVQKEGLELEEKSTGGSSDADNANADEEKNKHHANLKDSITQVRN
jgi:hypothetical protein